jgi:hypothetical protein
MTDLDAALFTRLSTFAALTALVPGAKISALTAVQGAVPPYVIYQTIDDIPDYAHDGLIALRHPRVQVSSYGTSLGAAKGVNTQVIAALATWPAANAEVQAVMIDNTIPLYDSTSGLFAMITDFIIEYTQS